MKRCPIRRSPGGGSANHRNCANHPVWLTIDRRPGASTWPPVNCRSTPFILPLLCFATSLCSPDRLSFGLRHLTGQVLGQQPDRRVVEHRGGRDCERTAELG